MVPFSISVLAEGWIVAMFLVGISSVLDPSGDGCFTNNRLSRSTLAEGCGRSKNDRPTALSVAPNRVAVLGNAATSVSDVAVIEPDEMVEHSQTRLHGAPWLAESLPGTDFQGRQRPPGPSAQGNSQS